MENPIIEKWWGSEEPEYYAIIKSTPIFIYETIVEEKVIYKEIVEYIQLPPEKITEYVDVDKTLPPEILLQYITVINVEFILFSGDQSVYNADSNVQSGTNLTDGEKATNNKIVSETADILSKNTDHLVILHGHANPITNTASEILELQTLSLARANQVADKLRSNYPGSPADLNSRMTTRGYGGGRNISGSSSSSYSGLNRRVEIMLIKIETLPSDAVPPGTGGN